MWRGRRRRCAGAGETYERRVCEYKPVGEPRRLCSKPETTHGAPVMRDKHHTPPRPPPTIVPAGEVARAHAEHKVRQRLEHLVGPVGDQAVAAAAAGEVEGDKGRVARRGRGDVGARGVPHEGAVGPAV